MIKTNQIILELIERNASVNEITSITGLSHKQLFHRLSLLKIKGYDFQRKYYYSGDICYELIKGLNEEKVNEATIITSKRDTEVKFLLISDLHFGNIKERPDLLYEVYNFCVKEGIHIIINTGDLVDGTFGYGGETNKKIIDIERQIDYLLKNYPFDKNILNFICLGNHDYSCLREKGLDLNKILDNKRHDLISLGYSKSIINIKNDKILLNHYIDDTFKIEGFKNYHLRFNGHHHRYYNSIKDNYVNFDLPSLTDMPIGNYKQFPSMILATLSFELGLFKIGKFEQFIYVNKDIYKIGENELDLIKGKNIHLSYIENEEERKPLEEKAINDVIKKLTPVEKKTNIEDKPANNLSKETAKTLKLSQIDKFNKKWRTK